MSSIKKTIANMLCGVLCVGAVAGAGAALYMGGKNNGWFDEYIKPDTEQSQNDNGENEKVEGMQIAPETSASQMRIRSRVLAVNEYSNYGVSTQAENAYTLTAEVLPEYAADKSLNWSVSWLYGESEWATDKDVNDYVTITPTTDGALTAVCSCLQDFGEPVTLTVSSRSNPSVSATCNIDYYQRVKSCEIAFTYDGEDYEYTLSNGVYLLDYMGENRKYYNIELRPIYSNYTREDTFTTSGSRVFSYEFSLNTFSQSTSTLDIPSYLKKESEGTFYYNCRAYLAMKSANGPVPESTMKSYLTAIENDLARVSTSTNVQEKFAYNVYMKYKNGTSTAKQAFDEILTYNFSSMAYDEVVFANFGEFVSAVQRCNSNGVGIFHFTVSFTGSKSSFETSFDVGFKDEVRNLVQDVNLSDTNVVF